MGVHQAVRKGLRGLPGGSSLARLLQDYRGAPNHKNRPKLKIEHILQWAKAHYRRTAKWPKINSAAVDDAPGETWNGIEHALRSGGRGLSGGSSLAQLLQERLGVRNCADPPKLTEDMIVEWADEHKFRTGKYPGVHSGEVLGHPGETWGSINASLKRGFRGLPGGSSLNRLLAERRGLRRQHNLPMLSEDEIWSWMEAHHERARKWPTDRSGPISEAPGETWAAVDLALRRGTRGLIGNSSLAKVRAERSEVNVN
jgi:hypothetical protein